ncbi:SLC13 family permease [uncultured Clostridium sp.]|jgi:Na+/H+ antiporter NhaD/arsenite permease-like protein|uniref:SLC13 family permease n=1 Tax=uncultured Clostridium sp. TaxID=59620 RepID=UPI0026176151|nr:SLC13 family permease [uncultured Clostridium sp.]
MNSKDLDKNKLTEFLKKEIILIIAVILAIISSFISMPKLSYINFKDLILLFNLMVVITGLKEFKLLDFIGTKLLHRDKSLKRIYAVMIFLTFFSSMLITDDVALITFVPLSLVLAKKANFNPVKLIVFQTIAAITGCSLTPMGSSQNLYIFTHFNLTSSEFFAVTLPITIVSFLLLVGFVMFQKNKTLDVSLDEVVINQKKLIVVYLILFLCVLASVFHLVNYRYAFAAVIIITLIIDKKLFLRVDYSLLLTFTAFFVFIGNVSAIPVVKTVISGLLVNNVHTYFIGLGISQVISNVPTTLLLSPFTHNYRALLLGVNNGGLFSLIGSMASIISYKFAISGTKTTPGKYIGTFAIYSLISLAVLVPASYIIIKFL